MNGMKSKHTTNKFSLMSIIFRRLLVLAGLGGGYFLYRKALTHVIYQNQNVFLNAELVEELKQKNVADVGGNRILIGSPHNKTYNSSKKRIVIIGGGLVGAASAYELSKNPEYDVILIEKHEQVGNETSFANGTIISPSLCYPWTSKLLLSKVFKSIFSSSDHSVSLSYNLLFEKYIFTWVLNLLFNLSDDKIESSCRRLIRLALEGNKELETMKQKNKLDDELDMSSMGTIYLYPTEEFYKSDEGLRSVKSKYGVSFKEMGYDELIKNEPFLKNVKDPIKKAAVSYNDSNADSLKMTQFLCEMAKRNGAIIDIGNEFQRFMFDRKSNLLGVVTSQGAIICDKVVIAGGYSSKDMIHKLGIRLPLIPVQGYTFTVPNKDHAKTPLKHTIVDDSGLVFLAPVKDKIRISGIADIGKVNEFDSKRLDTLVKAAKKYIPDIDANEGVSWTQVRPFTPDDVPIIGNLPGHENIYINTGHGSKGLTLCIGSGKILKDIIENRQKNDIEKDYSIKRFYLI